MSKVINSNWSQLGVSAVTTGTVAALVSAAALAALAKSEGKGALQPLNATSHWIQGDAAAKIEQPSASHTLVGFGTHGLASVLWAAIFEAWLAKNPPRSLGILLRDAFAMSGIAGVVDYGLTPHRFTPGWELALSKTSMLFAYVAFALGLAGGALASERVRDSGMGMWREAIPERLARLSRQ